MRTIFNRGAVALLNADEEAAAAAAAASNEGGEPADNANSLETDLTEVEASAPEGDKEDAAIDEAVETKEALEQYMAALEGYIGEGGVDAKAAHLMSIGVNFMSNRQGFRQTERTNIATEHFAGPSSKLKANQHALESIGEQVKKIWESIKAAIARAIAWLKEHYNKIFGAAEKLQKRATAIAEKAKNLTGSAKETKIDNERLAKALNISGTVPTGLSAALDKVLKVGEDSFGHTADFGATIGQSILDGMSETGTVDSLGTMGYGAGVLKTMAASEATAGGFDAAPENMGWFRSEELPGGKAVIARYPSSTLKGQAAVDALSKATGTVGAFNNKAPEVTKTEVPVLATAEIGKVADTVAAIAKAVIGYRAKADKAAGLKTKILAAADKLSKTAEKEEDKEKAAYMSATQKLASASVNAIDKPAPQMAQYMLVTGKAALDLCEESIKQYGAK